MRNLFLIGLASGAVLTVLLGLTRASKLEIWPCPEPWSLEGVSFWTLFRAANLAALGVILFYTAPGLFESPLRIVAAGFGLLCFSFYIFACLELGRENLYCGAAGLKVRGIYRWSRNPQYATAIPGYLAIAVAAGTAEALILAGMLAVIFFQMAMIEDRWLRETYGINFEVYQARVPRFYNVRRMRSLGRSARRKVRSMGYRTALDRAKRMRKTHAAPTAGRRSVGD